MLQVYKTIRGYIQEIDSFAEKGIWINLTDPSEGEIAEVSARTGIEADFLKAALDAEERPRIEAEDGQVLIVIDIPYIAGKDSPVTYNTIPLGIVVTEEAIVTVCLQHSVLIEEMIRRKSLMPHTQKKTRFVLQILFNNARLYLNYLKQIDKLTTEIENELHKSMKNEELIRLLNLEKSLVYFTTSLRANEIVLEKLLRTYLKKMHDEESQITVQILKMYEEDEDLLEDVITENKQAMEMGEIYTNILTGMMDAFASVISNNLNIVMKFLTSVTIIMAIPTIIGSFFGMNVRLPYQNSPHAFFGIVVFTGLSVLTGILILAKKRMF